MNPAFQCVKELFLASLEKQAPGERQAFLDEACGTDEPLRRQVEALLRQHEQAGSCLEQPPAAEAGATSDLPQGRVVREEDLATATPEGPGTRLGQEGLGQRMAKEAGGCPYRRQAKRQAVMANQADHGPVTGVLNEAEAAALGLCLAVSR
jgi:hypothetical protein